MLVVDGVELVRLDQAQEVRELHREHAARRRGGAARPADEVVEVGHVREHVVAEQEVGAARARPPTFRAVAAPKKASTVGMPAFSRPPPPRCARARCRAPGRRAPGSAGGGSRRCSPSRRPGSRPPSPNARDHGLDVAPRVLDPGVRVGREVGVVGEDVGRAHDLGKLHEPAALAHEGMEREERLGLAEVIPGEVAIGEW